MGEFSCDAGRTKPSFFFWCITSARRTDLHKTQRPFQEPGTGPPRPSVLFCLAAARNARDLHIERTSRNPNGLTGSVPCCLCRLINCWSTWQLVTGLWDVWLTVALHKTNTTTRCLSITAKRRPPGSTWRSWKKKRPCLLRKVNSPWLRGKLSPDWGVSRAEATRCGRRTQVFFPFPTIMLVHTVPCCPRILYASVWWCMLCSQRTIMCLYSSASLPFGCHALRLETTWAAAR
ncbi:hypothetical protein VTO42DRAFT_3803 [Malbranchea cinnamomea]